MNKPTQQHNLLNALISDGGFLQSEEWRNFQEQVGKKTVFFKEGEVQASVIEHVLPLAGKYAYAPRGPVFDTKNTDRTAIKSSLQSLLACVRETNAGWFRVEPNDERALELLREVCGKNLVKAPHDMQPREILILPIDASEEAILAKMKSKTRYNIRLAEKKGVRVFTSREEKYVDAFCKLITVTARRDGIVSHSENYYRTMMASIPEDMLQLSLAEYQGEIIAANLTVFFGNTATYLHGASSDRHREAMAPYLLQWRAIQSAKQAGCTRYDFGGTSVSGEHPKWTGITRFKQGFAPEQTPITFPGAYDIILSRPRYILYRALQRVKQWL